MKYGTWWTNSSKRASSHRPESPQSWSSPRSLSGFDHGDHHGKLWWPRECVLAFVATGVIVANLTYRSPQPADGRGDKGHDPYFGNGTINTEEVPDFIATLGRDGKIVGYVPRAYLIPGRSISP